MPTKKVETAPQPAADTLAALVLSFSRNTVASEVVERVRASGRFEHVTEQMVYAIRFKYRPSKR